MLMLLTFCLWVFEFDVHIIKYFLSVISCPFAKLPLQTAMVDDWLHSCKFQKKRSAKFISFAKTDKRIAPLPHVRISRSVRHDIMNLAWCGLRFLFLLTLRANSSAWGESIWNNTSIVKLFYKRVTPINYFIKFYRLQPLSFYLMSFIL